MEDCTFNKNTEMDETYDIDEPTIEDVIEIIKKSKKGKAPGNVNTEQFRNYRPL